MFYNIKVIHLFRKIAIIFVKKIIMAKNSILDIFKSIDLYPVKVKKNIVYLSHFEKKDIHKNFFSASPYENYLLNNSDLSVLLLNELDLKKCVFIIPIVSDDTLNFLNKNKLHSYSAIRINKEFYLNVKHFKNKKEAIEYKSLFQDTNDFDKKFIDRLRTFYLTNPPNTMLNHSDYIYLMQLIKKYGRERTIVYIVS